MRHPPTALANCEAIARWDSFASNGRRSQWTVRSRDSARDIGPNSEEQGCRSRRPVAYRAQITSVATDSWKSTSASPFSLAHSVSIAIGVCRVSPSGVKRYSPRAGDSALTVRSMSPLLCSRRRVSVRTLREIPPMSSTSSPCRFGPSVRANSVTTDHLLAMMSIAVRAGQSARKTVPGTRFTPSCYPKVPSDFLS